MCLAIPAEVISVDGDMAQVSVGGVKKEVSISLVDDVNEGDYLLIHVGYALNKISPEEAQKTLELFKEAGMLGGES